MFTEVPYDRALAVAYADRWAYGRNPEYYDFSRIGGDCTNFASQCVFAGAGYMNYTPTFGWYYISVNNRAPAWTGVRYFYDFLTTNKGAGPFGREVPLSQTEPGDIVQLDLGSGRFRHTPVVVRVDGAPSADTVFVAAHSLDCNCRPLSSYGRGKARFVHIEGVRRPV